MRRPIGEPIEVVRAIDPKAVDDLALGLAQVPEHGGRLFVLGPASHAVCDFRKVCGLEAYAPIESVSELTARVNEERSQPRPSLR